MIGALVGLALGAPLVVGDVQAPPGELSGVDLVTPGFVDAHAHPGWLGQVLEQVDLTGADSYAEALAILREAPMPPGDGWVRGHGWDQTRWPDAPRAGWPRARDLDRIFGDRPVWLTRVDGHAAWANRAALVGLPSEDPVGGRILRRAGRPDGVVIDGAMSLVSVPEPGPQDVARQLGAALEDLARRGLTGVHAMAASDAEIVAYEAMASEDQLPVDVWVWALAGTEGAEALLRDGPRRSGRLRVVGVKAFADGALGSRGALLTHPYSDDPATHGIASAGPEELTALTTRGLQARVSVAVHAIGDLAVHRALDAFEAARAAVPEAAAVPLRVEHAQVVAPEDQRRFAALGVVASMQPVHCTSDMGWAGDRLGPERLGWAYAWRSLRDAGATLAFGSDVPVESPDPGAALLSGTCRCRADGHPTGGFTPSQRLTLAEVVEGFTLGAWAAAGERAEGDDLTLWRRVPGALERFEPIGRRYRGRLERW